MDLASSIVSIIVLSVVSGSPLYKTEVHVKSGDVVPMGYYTYGPPPPYSAQLLTPPNVYQGLPPCALPCVHETMPNTQKAQEQPLASPKAVQFQPTYLRENSGYEYSYLIYNDETGDHKSHHEKSDGAVVRGQYSLIQPDGLIREVQYTAGEDGFNAIVKNIRPNSPLQLMPCRNEAHEHVPVGPKMEKLILAPATSEHTAHVDHTTAPHTDAPHTTVHQTEAAHTEAHTTVAHTEVPQTTVAHTEAPHTTVAHTEAPHTTVAHTEAPHTTITHTESYHTDPPQTYGVPHLELSHTEIGAPHTNHSEIDVTVEIHTEGPIVVEELLTEHLHPESQHLELQNPEEHHTTQHHTEEHTEYHTTEHYQHPTTEHYAEEHHTTEQNMEEHHTTEHYTQEQPTTAHHIDAHTQDVHSVDIQIHVDQHNTEKPHVEVTTVHDNSDIEIKFEQPIDTTDVPLVDETPSGTPVTVIKPIIEPIIEPVVQLEPHAQAHAQEISTAQHAMPPRIYLSLQDIIRCAQKAAGKTAESSPSSPLTYIILGGSPCS